MRRPGLAIAVLLLAVAAVAGWTTCGGPGERVGGVSSVMTNSPATSATTPAPASEPAAPPPRIPRPRARTETAPAADGSAAPTAAAEKRARVDLRIRVLRPDGSPAAGATVTCAPDWDNLVASPPLLGDPLGAGAHPAVADADGCIVCPVGPGTEYAIAAEAVVAARLGDEVARVRFVVPEASTDVEMRLVHGFLVSGTVRTSDGAPAAGATVSIGMDRLVMHGIAPDLRRNCMVITDSDGRFEAGPFVREDPASELPISADRDDLLPARLVLAPGDSTRDLVFTLKPAVALRGRVVNEKREPVARTWLLFHDGSYGDEQRILTDEHGRFTARMSPTARGDMIFVVHEYVARRIPDALRVPGVRDLGDVVVRRGGTIRGRVVREDGTPAERPHVGVLSLDLGVAICEARMGPGATFEGWRVGPGEHVLHVRDGTPPSVGGGWDPVEVRGCFAGTEGLRVVVTDGPGVLVRLHAAGDAADAPPRTILEVGVTASRGPGEASKWRWMGGRRGAHSIRVPARAGAAIDIEVTADGYATWRADGVRVPEGRAAVLDAFLVPEPKESAAPPR